MSTEPNAIVFRHPLDQCAAELRADAERWRGKPGDEAVADAYADAAERLAKRIEAANVGEWILTEDAAPLVRLEVDTVRWRCRTKWHPKGLAKKQGGRWYVHASVLAPQ